MLCFLLVDVIIPNFFVKKTSFLLIFSIKGLETTNLSNIKKINEYNLKNSFKKLSYQIFSVG